MSYPSRLRLFALGETFDPDAFARVTSLRIDRVWRRGERCRDAGSVHPASSGVDIYLDDGRPPPLPRQEAIAFDFLRAHRDELAALRHFPGVTTFVLALHYPIALEENLLGFSLSASPSLLRACVEAGISPTFYVWPRRTDAYGDADADADGA
jgi:hypothetical protein